jgi:asparagine synthetase B (glutamine-hydrolysing)
MIHGKTTIFGDNVTYHNRKETNQNIIPLVQQGFKDFSPEGITSFFSFRYPVWNFSMFQDIFRVPFGCEMKNGEIVSEWLPHYSHQKHISIDAAIKTIDELLLEAVRRATRGHKIAIPLSGGVDSSLMVAMCRKLYPNATLYTYSAGFYGDDEFEYSRMVAEIFQTVHQEKVLGQEDYIGEHSLLRPLIRFKAEPLHPNELALASVEKMAKEDGCTLAVCGEGSDDLFGGYGQNLRMYMNYRQDRPFIQFFLDHYRYFTLEDRHSLVRDKYLVDDLSLLNEPWQQKKLPADIRDQVFYFIQKLHTPGLITRGANAMRFNGLELGFPFIDADLLEFTNSLPFDYKVAWKSPDHEKDAQTMDFRKMSEEMDIPKYILKRLAEKYLPREIIYRQKKGFPVPFGPWLENLHEWDLDQSVFKTSRISHLSGWKKFMIINLNACLEEFRAYKKS